MVHKPGVVSPDRRRPGSSHRRRFRPAAPQGRRPSHWSRMPSGESSQVFDRLPAPPFGQVGNVGSNENQDLRQGRPHALGRVIRPTVRGVAMNPVDHPHGGVVKARSRAITRKNRRGLFPTLGKKDGAAKQAHRSHDRCSAGSKTRFFRPAASLQIVGCGRRRRNGTQGSRFRQ